MAEPRVTAFGKVCFIDCIRINDDEPIPPCSLYSEDDGITLIPIDNSVRGIKPAAYASLTVNRSFWKIRSVVRIEQTNESKVKPNQKTPYQTTPQTNDT